MTCFESENRICNNTIGSYICDCMEGYQENKTSQVCEGWFGENGYKDQGTGVIVMLLCDRNCHRYE